MSAALRQDLDDARKGLAEWRALALAAQAQVKHQSGMRESELVALYYSCIIPVAPAFAADAALGLPSA